MRAIALAVVVAPAVAAAHVHLTFPMSRTDSLLGDQKEQFCGNPAYVRADHPERNNVFAPGATITVTWMETVNHPGHFRIAVQPDGEVFGIPPASGTIPGKCKAPAGQVNCPAGVTNCDFPNVNQEGVDPSNGSIVLKDFIADGTSSIGVTLPNMECTTCTLQFIQVMNDKCPYTTDATSDDIYFNCADLTLSATAPDAPPPMGDGFMPMDEAGVNPGTGDGGGGCCSSSGGGATGLFGLLAFAKLLDRRGPRRRSPRRPRPISA